MVSKRTFYSKLAVVHAMIGLILLIVATDGMGSADWLRPAVLALAAVGNLVYAVIAAYLAYHPQGVDRE